MRVLVTAGPTREPIDPVRYLSNHSSGRMGYAIASALRERGHEVVLVSGPTALRPPSGVRLIRIETAREMLSRCRKHWPECQALIAVAAVADFRPAQACRHKLKRSEGEGQTLELVPNPDIVASLAKTKGQRTVVGFALESQRGKSEALRKLRGKGLDFIALNGPQAQGSERASLRVFDDTGREHALGPAHKRSLARSLVRMTIDAPGVEHQI